ncbi:hypothetical protein ID866_12691 [Astraeus odoratus]|nr:hypothetical protein ID866_12691 [Astraeus odoratus]
MQASRIKSWLSQPDAPTIIQECWLLFNKHLSSGEEPLYDSAQLNNPKKLCLPIPHDLYQLVSSKQCIFYAHFKFSGVTFSQYSTHVGNSLILFYSGGNVSSPPVPGCIKYIIVHNDIIQFAVNHHPPASVGVYDPFSHYPYFPTCLYDVKLSDTLELVQPLWVMCHIARW